MISRRKFIRLSALSAPLLTGIDQSVPLSDNNSGPIVLATWQAGLEVNATAWAILAANGKSVDAIEAGARYMENKLDCCVGLGGNPDRDGIVTLDAAIMDANAQCGAVAGLEQIRHPISVARKLMETTPHVLLVGNGAQQFAVQNGFTKEPARLSPSAEKAYKQWLINSNYQPIINIENAGNKGPYAPHFLPDGTPNHDTMGLLAMDAMGDLSGGVTTSGMAFKLHGRVGDSAIIGAGLFVDNEVGAATSSGVGEEVIRICGTHLVVEFMRQGLNPAAACKKAIDRIIGRDPKKAAAMQVGFIAVNKKGEYGAHALQKGFVYAVRSNRENRVYAAPFEFNNGVK